MKRNYERELSNICDALAESVYGMTDEEVAAEAAENGENVDAIADEVRQLLRNAIETHKENI